MTKQEQINNWLKIGFGQSENRLSEVFYYDKRDHEFFSILLTDYFILDDNLNIEEGVTTNYSKQNLETLVERIKRIESKNESIIPLPRLGAGTTEEFISQQIEDFLTLNSINMETLSLCEVEEDGTITFKIEPDLKKSWWKFW